MGSGASGKDEFTAAWYTRAMADTLRALQDTYAPHNECFGCGPANAQGLRLKSRVETLPDGSEDVVADFTPAPWHLAFAGVVNGGIIGALLDCHSNWAATYALMKAQGAATPPCTVTADFHVKLKKPTPLQALRLHARAVDIQGDRAVVEATLTAEGKVCATCRGTFVAVKEGHPAYHRW
jgi:acyl-coenzyme A thioesterase PaaI-like protein